MDTGSKKPQGHTKELEAKHSSVFQKLENNKKTKLNLKSKITHEPSTAKVTRSNSSVRMSPIIKPQNANNNATEKNDAESPLKQHKTVIIKESSWIITIVIGEILIVLSLIFMLAKQAVGYNQ